jgi:hypothetical protein
MSEEWNVRARDCGKLKTFLSITHASSYYIVLLYIYFISEKCVSLHLPALARVVPKFIVAYFPFTESYASSSEPSEHSTLLYIQSLNRLQL